MAAAIGADSAGAEANTGRGLGWSSHTCSKLLGYL